MTPEVAAYISTVKNAYQLWMSNLAIKERVGIRKNRLMLYIQACFVTGYIKIIDRYYSKTNPDVDNFITKELMDILRDRVDRILRVPAVPAITYYGPLTFAYSGTQCIIKLKAVNGEPVVIDWGNGKTTTVSGHGDMLISVSSIYTSTETFDIKFSCTKNAITYFDINNQNCGGSISWIVAWSSLTYLDLYDNSGLTGDLTNLYLLTALKHIDLYNTTLTTCVITSWSSLTNLEYIDLRGSNATGVVTSWSSMTSLEEVHIGIGTTCSGVITNWGNSNLTHLRILDMPDCSLTGTMTYLMTISTLEEMILNDNVITGSIYSPTPIAINLRYVNLSGTSVTGIITQWSAFESLEYLNFNAVTGITGTIGYFYYLNNLETLIINAATAITGNIGNYNVLTKLKYLDISHTAITGDILNWSGGMNLIEHIDIHDTALIGDVSQFFNFDNIVFIMGDDTNTEWSTTDGWLAKDNISLSFNSAGWISDDVDDCLISLAGGGIPEDCILNSYIDIAGTNDVRTAASDLAIALLNWNGNTVIVNI